MRIAAVIALALVGAGCSQSDSPTSPSFVELTVTTGAFVGQLSSGASRFYSFTVRDGGTVSVMLASVTAPATGAALDVPLGLGLGVPAGTGCALSRSVQTASALTAQLSAPAPAGVHCVSVYDVGAVRAPVNFAIRFNHP
jgi:hypothetical protein